MATGSGLDAQFGAKTESTVGTKVTVDRFFDFDSSDLTFDPSYIEGSGIQAGRKFKSVNQAGIARKSAGGKIEIPVLQQGFGWFWKHFIGSTGTATQITSETAYKQIHTPGDLSGISFTAQIGKPEPDTGTVKPFTYNGCKVTDWDITMADNANTICSFTIDAWDEDTATTLATASYPTDNIEWNFAHITTFTIGGTAATSAGETTITGGTSVASVVNSVTLSGKNTLATDRYGIGNGGTKKEQLEIDFTSITGSFKAEFNSADFQNDFKAGTSTALQIDHVGAVIDGSDTFLLSFILPTVKITKAP